MILCSPNFAVSSFGQEIQIQPKLVVSKVTTQCTNIISNLQPAILTTGFLPRIFFRDKIYCYASFFCYANFSIVFGPNFGGSNCLRKAPPCPLWKQARRSKQYHKMIILKMTSMYDVWFVSVYSEINRNPIEIGLSAHFLANLLLTIVIFH